MYLRIFELPPRHPNQTAANYAFNGRCAHRAAAFALLSCHVTPSKWLTLHFVFHFIDKLRRPAELRAAAMKRMLSSPEPMIGYDLGLDEKSKDLIIRSPDGKLLSHHPSKCSISLDSISVYSPLGDLIKPLIPPPSSGLVLCAEATGAWCYRNVDLGTTYWHLEHPDLPKGIIENSTTISIESLPILRTYKINDQPPRFDSRFTLDNLERSSMWLVLRNDQCNVIHLYNRLTGSTRLAPWFTYTFHGRPCFINFVTHEMRWFPPLGWLDGWITFISPFDKRSFYARHLLPHALARMHVEGGASYPDSTGTPLPHALALQKPPVSVHHS